MPSPDSLAIYVPGNTNAMSARLAKNVLGQMISLLDTVTAERKGDWRLTDLHLGSLSIALCPDETVAEDAEAIFNRAPSQVVQGLQDVASTHLIPSSWTPQEGRAALRLLKSAGPGSRISVVRDNEAIRSIEVDDHVIASLELALSNRHTSFGSVEGHLKELLDGRSLTARLVTPGGREVVVDYGLNHVDQVQALWRNHRVEITGEISEDASGEALRVNMFSARLVDQPRLTPQDLTGGFYPDLTGGLTVQEHVRQMRDGE